MFENVYLDFATVSAVVAAFVSVMGNAFNIQPKYRSVLAIIVGVVFMMMPPWLMEKSVAALLIGLTASGVYTQVKKREYVADDKKNSGNSQPLAGEGASYPPGIHRSEDV